MTVIKRRHFASESVKVRLNVILRTPPSGEDGKLHFSFCHTSRVSVERLNVDWGFNLIPKHLEYFNICKLKKAKVSIYCVCTKMGDYQLPLVANKCISINKWNHKTVGERTEFWFLLIKKMVYYVCSQASPHNQHFWNLWCRNYTFYPLRRSWTKQKQPGAVI